MQRMTKAILIVVLIAFIVFLSCITFLSRAIITISTQYEEGLTTFSQNKDCMSDINENMYHIQSLLWEHILNIDEEGYTKLEEEIQRITDDTRELIGQLQESLTEPSQMEALHQVSSCLSNLNSHKSVVYSLSRDGSKESAKYYVVTNVMPDLQRISTSLNAMDDNINVRYGEAEKALDDAFYELKMGRGICYAAVLLIIVFALTVIIQSGRRIVTVQDEVMKNHEKHVMELQYKIIVGMANLIESRDGETGEHVKRTVAIVDMIAKELQNRGIYADILSDSYIDNLSKAAPLHDIGKILISDTVLQKPGKLTEEEFEIIKRHASEGGRIIYETVGEIEERDYINIAHDVAMYHHEKWDGNGYPEGRRGLDIPLSARIMAVADVFDALISERCYKKAMTVGEAYQIIEENSGSHFDPKIVDVFVLIRPKVEKYLEEQK